METPGRGRPRVLRPPLPLCAQVVARRGPHRLFQCTQSRWVPRAAAAAAATPEPVAAKRGSGSAQLLIIPEESS